MGSEKKLKEEKTNKKRSSSSASEDEGKSKRRRTIEDEEKKRSKSDKKEKRKSKRSHKHSKHHSDEDIRLLGITRCTPGMSFYLGRFDYMYYPASGVASEKQLGSMHKDKHGKRDNHSFQELSNDDYFAKNNEFATWLKDEKKMFFSDLSSESARKLFSRFVKDWNKQKLEPRYYEGIASAPRTAHNWKIK